jgi:hypothetical protein
MDHVSVYTCFERFLNKLRRDLGCLEVAMVQLESRQINDSIQIGKTKSVDRYQRFDPDCQSSNEMLSVCSVPPRGHDIL